MNERALRSLGGIGLMLLFLCASLLTFVQAQSSIRLGHLIDLSGPTSSLGHVVLKGQLDAVYWFNERGGVNGRKIELLTADYAYKPSVALAEYKRFVEKEKVPLILGWGTPDAEFLRPFVAKDRVLFLSGSCSAELTDPRHSPYNFVPCVDYSTQIRIFLRWVKDTWRDRSRRPRVAFIWVDNAFGRAPIGAGRKFAAEIGVDLVDEQILPTSSADPIPHLLSMRRRNPDFAFVNLLPESVPPLLKESRNLRIPTKYVVSNYGWNERTVEVAGRAAEGMIGIGAHAQWTDDVPGKKTLIETHKRLHPNEPLPPATYIAGWVWVIQVVEALRRAGDNPTGQSLKVAFESFQDVDVWGLAPPVTYTRENHSPTNKAKLYVVESGIAKPLTGYIEVPRRVDD